MTVQGSLSCNDGDLDTQIENLIDAYSVNGKTLALYDSGGTRTRHALDATASSLLDGPKIVRHVWPKGDRGEYASCRSYYIEATAIQAYYDSSDPWQGILKYQEQLFYEGSGGASFRWVHDQIGNPTKRIRIPGTSFYLHQRGHGIGQTGYVLPLPAVEPTMVAPERTRLTYTSPTIGTGYNGVRYESQWNYTMELPNSNYFDAYTPVSR
jgi:hypothetical protein